MTTFSKDWAKRARTGLLATTAVALMAGMAHAETWRFAHKMPADSPEGIVFQFFADRVGELTEGDVEVQVFPSEQLGKEDAILEQLELGTVNLYAEDAFFLQKWVPDIKWIAPHFLFQNREDWVAFTETDLVKSWLDEVEEIAGVRPLGNPVAVVRGPYRVLISKKPVETYEDIAGLKLRMYPDELAISVWQHLGADLQMLSWTEVYQSLQSGVADSVTSPAALVEAMKFYEQAPYITRTNEFWQGLAFAMNAEAFDALPEKDQAALLQAHEETAAYSLKLMTENADAMQGNLEALGVTFTDMPLEPLFANMAEWYRQLDAAGDMPEGLLEAALPAAGN
ncbi:TRAP transporter substrate-binding protein [Salipiger sp. P9]|uniref:TRAP transporter substrate-binding protein n=1 Tax=Salipiger pentaromativorans TaxID=2943193 RepID=UPI00215849DB|nr:TRAP transporter substrate-binding protein [Salipiger pentaromativorans]MCR8549283.1 TRAP transporter substrate-binding protein [Salipiger pentaromativorans]